MARMTDEELVALVDGEFDRAMGADGGDIASERAKAWNFYLSKPLGNEVDGQSQVVTSDVADVVDGIMPSLLRIFTVADNLAEFEPVGPEDEAGAAQESDYVNHVFFKQNPAFLILYVWFFDALVQKNGVVKAWVDEREETTTERYEGLSAAELAELLDDPELEPVERDERQGTVIETIETAAGPVQQPVEATVHDVTFRRTTKKRRVRVANVPPEEYRVSADTVSVDPSEARMVGQEREATRAELIEMGFDRDLVDSLPIHGQAAEAPEERARKNKTDETDDAPHDPSQDKILIREGYIRVDFERNGRVSLRQVITAGGHILANEEADRQPFHVLSPQPLPHKHFGRALAEKVMDVQEVNTTLVRQILNNLYHTSQPGHAVWEQAIGDDTLDDLLTTKAGAIRRFARPVGDSWTPMTVPFTAGATFPMLEFWEKVKRDRTGISSDGEGLNPEALKNIQTSVLAQVADLARMKIEAVTRIFAETGIKSLFLHIHKLVLKHQDKAEVVRLRGQWVQVDPREWRTRRDMTVKIGLGIGTREQNLLHLNAIWEKQKEIFAGGGAGVLLKPRHLFATVSEIVKNANLNDGERFFANPGDADFPPPPDQNDQLARAQLEIAQRQQALDAQEQEIDRERNLLQHERELEKIRISQEKAQNDLLVALENIATKLTELELKFAADVPGAKV